MEYKSCGLLSHLDILCQLNGRYTLLMGTDKVHCHEPLSQRNLSVLKDCTNCLTEVCRAVVAMESSVSTFNALDGTTMGANDVFAPSLLTEDFLALGFGVKVGN